MIIEVTLINGKVYTFPDNYVYYNDGFFLIIYEDIRQAKSFALKDIKSFKIRGKEVKLK